MAKDNELKRCGGIHRFYKGFNYAVYKIHDKDSKASRLQMHVKLYFSS